MRKFGIGTLVLVLGVGMIILAGCGGSDGGAAGGLPQSAASYMGSNMPANIDSNTGSNYSNFYNQVLNQGGVVRTNDSGSQEILINEAKEGDISGTYTFTHSMDLTYGPTGGSHTGITTVMYDNWEDSGNEDPHIVRGSGSFFHQLVERQNYDGVEPDSVEPEGLARAGSSSGIGTYLGSEAMIYENYSDFAQSSADPYPNGDFPFDELTAGWASWNYSESGKTGVWSRNLDANIAYNNFYDEEYSALLNATATAGYDGSVTTLVAAGRFCEEGIGIGGCLDYEIDLQWDGDEDPAQTDVMPDDGTINISTVDAKAMFDFSYTSDPLCYLLSVDADNDSAYEFTVVECEIP